MRSSGLLSARSGIALLMLLASVFQPSARAQAPPSATPLTPPGAAGRCPTRTAPASPGEQAALRDDAGAEALLREEGKAPGEVGDRAHNALIRLLVREQKVDAAELDAKAWAAAAPGSAWAQTSFAEAEWRKGELKEAIDSLNLAGKLDPCNARTHADLARLKLLQGNYASARAQIDFAHALDPISQDITSRWINLQPPGKRLENLNGYLASNATLTDDQRKNLERLRGRLATPVAEQPCHLVGSVGSATIPFRRIQDGPQSRVFWGLEVAFNGNVRRLEVDTGAHGLLLNRTAAQALNLEAETHTSVGGIGDEGRTSAHLSRVKSIKIGPLEFANCDVEVLETDRKAVDTQDGLIGGDVFASFLLTLDFPGHRMKLDPLPVVPGSDIAENTPSLATAGTPAEDHSLQDAYVDPSMSAWTRVFRSGHDLLLPVRLENGPIRLFLVDTGSHMDVIAPQVAQQVGHQITHANSDVIGLSGTNKQTFRTGPLTLSFAGLRYPNPGMFSFDTAAVSRSAGLQIAGILGTPTLRTLTLQIDYRDNLMHFNYDPNRVVKCVGQNTGDCD